MMARVSLGHTGRGLQASPTATAAFGMVTLGALVRVGMGLIGGPGYRTGVIVAGTAWSVAFALFVLGHAAMSWAPRVDGKPG